MKDGTAEEFDTYVSGLVTSAGNLTDTYKDKLSVLDKYDTGSLSSSAAKGIAQASQDSVDELNGRFTAIQSHTYSINENMKEMQTRQAVILTEIMGIHTDTSSLKTMLINGTARVKIN